MTQDFEDNLKIDTMHNFFACQITKIFYDFFTIQARADPESNKQ